MQPEGKHFLRDSITSLQVFMELNKNVCVIHTDIETYSKCVHSSFLSRSCFCFPRSPNNIMLPIKMFLLHSENAQQNAQFGH